MAEIAHGGATAPAIRPPRIEIGVLGWMRKNLFSSIPNTILSVEKVRDTLTRMWPQQEERFRANADAYVAQLRELVACRLRARILLQQLLGDAHQFLCRRGVALRLGLLVHA